MKASLAGSIDEEDVWQYALREVEMIANSLMDMPNMFMGINWHSIELVQTSLTNTLQKFFASHEQKYDLVDVIICKFES